MSDINKQIMADRIDTAFGVYLNSHKEKISCELQNKFDSLLKEQNLCREDTLTVEQLECILPAMQATELRIIINSISHVLTDVLSELLDEEPDLL